MEQNLKLLVIDQLIKTNLLEYDEAFCDAIYDKIDEDDDLADDLYAQPIPELMDYFLQMDITPYLDQVTELFCEGGHMIYTLVAYQWDGEDDVFDLTSLEGIELLPNLKSLRAHTMVKGPISLQPLTPLQHLHRLSLNTKHFTDFEALLQLNALKQVDFHYLQDKNNPPQTQLAGSPPVAVKEALQEKGVLITCP